MDCPIKIVHEWYKKARLVDQIFFGTIGKQPTCITWVLKNEPLFGILNQDLKKICTIIQKRKKQCFFIAENTKNVL